MFPWLNRRRRRRLLASPIAPDWLDHLDRNMALYASLSAAERQRLQDDLRVFVAEKNWEGCGGLTLTDEIKVTIAAHACLLLLGMEHDFFGRVMSVLVYPSTYLIRQTAANSESLLVGGKEARLGEAWYRGPVILAWDAVVENGRDPRQGSNLVLHEFAHQLDFIDGLADGTPPLKNRDQYRQWHHIMTAEYERLIRQAEHGEESLLDPYGSTDPCEFFAVISENFFTQPKPLYERHRAIYDLLCEYYRQDPRMRSEGEAKEK